MRKVFLAHVRPLLNYAGCAWQSQANVDRLERVQDSCLRAVTSQTLSTPTEALHAEAEVSSMRSCISASDLRSREKALRLPPDHPRRLSFSGTTPSRLRSTKDAKSAAEELSRNLPIPQTSERTLLIYFPV